MLSPNYTASGKLKLSVQNPAAPWRETAMLGASVQIWAALNMTLGLSSKTFSAPMWIWLIDDSPSSKTVPR
jgi:hypothetical protein